MRILFISQWFDPEPTFKGLFFARALQNRGHHIEVLTGFPNYPGGRVYPGYKVRLYQRDVIKGIPVHRVALYPSHDTRPLHRILNYTSFAASAAVIGTIMAKRADVAYVYHPPATAGLPAVTFEILRGIPFVYDIQDLWPDTLAATGMFNNPRLLKAVDYWCQFIYRQASRIVVLSPGIKRILITRGVPGKKIEVIYNWCDEEAIHPQKPPADIERQLGFNGHFNIIYAGNIGRAQSLDTVLDAAEIFKEKHPHVRFVFVGAGVEEDRLKQMTINKGLHNITFLGRRSPAEVAPILFLADALLVHLRKDPLFEITIPSKTQAYLAMGKPVLMGVSGDAADLVKRSGAGICFPQAIH